MHKSSNYSMKKKKPKYIKMHVS